MMTISKGLFISFALAANWAFAGLDFQLSASTIHAGERIRLTLDLNEPVSDEESPLVFDELLGNVKNLIVLERHSERTPTGFRWIYELTSYQPGAFKLPPVQIRQGGNTFSTEAVNFEVTAQRTQADQELRDNYGEVRNPLPWKKWGRWFVWLFFTLLSFPLMLKLLRAIPWAKLSKLKLPQRSPTPENPADWLRKSLAAIRAKLESEGPQPAILEEIELTVKTYYKKRTQLPVTAFTTQEFTQVFASQKVGKPVAQVLTQFDAYKYRRLKSNLDFLGQSLHQIEELLLPCGS